MDVKLIFGALALHFFALITPGPDFILTIRNTLRKGRISGLATSLGFGLGIAIHVSYSLAGISYLIKEFPGVYHFIRYIGATYLIWIGISGLRSLKQGEEESIEATGSDSKSSWDCFAQGFLTNILNPKATLFILGLFTSITGPGVEMKTLIVTGLGMVLMTVLWFSVVTWTFSVQQVRTYYFRAEKILNVIFGVFFIGTGVALIIS